MVLLYSVICHGLRVIGPARQAVIKMIQDPVFYSGKGLHQAAIFMLFAAQA